MEQTTAAPCKILDRIRTQVSPPDKVAMKNPVAEAVQNITMVFWRPKKLAKKILEMAVTNWPMLLILAEIYWKESCIIIKWNSLT